MELTILEKQLVNLLKKSGLDAMDTLMVCLGLQSSEPEMQNLRNYILENEPTRNEIMDWFGDCLERIGPIDESETTEE